MNVKNDANNNLVKCERDTNIHSHLAKIYQHVPFSVIYYQCKILVILHREDCLEHLCQAYKLQRIVYVIY